MRPSGTRRRRATRLPRRTIPSRRACAWSEVPVPSARFVNLARIVSIRNADGRRSLGAAAVLCRCGAQVTGAVRIRSGAVRTVGPCPRRVCLLPHQAILSHSAGSQWPSAPPFGGTRFRGAADDPGQGSRVRMGGRMPGWTRSRGAARRMTWAGQGPVARHAGGCRGTRSRGAARQGAWGQGPCVRARPCAYDFRLTTRMPAETRASAAMTCAAGTERASRRMTAESTAPRTGFMNLNTDTRDTGLCCSRSDQMV